MRLQILSLVVVFLMVSAVCPAGLWEPWEWLNPRPQGHTLNGLAASDTLVVAVGEEGVILASDDGFEWDVVHSEAGLVLQDAAWTGNLFIAVGGGIILTSMDGRRWTERYVVGAWLNEVIFNGELILAVGAHGKTVTSPDGMTWLEHELQNHPNSEMVDVAWNGSVFVGVGGPNPFVGADRAILFSDDGISWTEASVDFWPPSGRFNAVIWDSERFLAFGGSPFVYSSADGVTWALTVPDLKTEMNAVIWTGDQYAAAGWGGQVALSNDGRSWSAETIFPAVLYDIVAFQGKYIIVGMDGAMAVSSDGGEDWAHLTTWEIEIRSGDIVAMDFGDGTLVAGSSWGVFTSSDGLEWQLVEDALPGTLLSIRWLNDAHWAVGFNRLIAHSSDGIAWDIRHNGEGALYADIEGNGEVFVAVGGRTGGGAVVATSTDGFAWNEFEIDGSDGLRIESVSWSGVRFVGVGDQATIFLSDDGYQWSFEALDSFRTLSHVVSNGSVVVAEGSDDQGRFLLASDDHGATWSFFGVDESIQDMIWNGELFIAVGNGTIWSSRDGHHWVTEAGDFAGIRCVAGDEDQIIGAGFKGWVKRAKRGRFNAPYHSAAELE